MEIFGGYSYLRTDADQRFSPMKGANLNGWQTALKFNLTPRLGLLADASGHYGKVDLRPGSFLIPQPGQEGRVTPVVTEPGAARQHTFLSSFG